MNKVSAGVVFAFALSSVKAFQGNVDLAQTELKPRLQEEPTTRHVAQDEERELKLRMLDQTEVEKQGAHCLDGSTPGYYFAEGTENTKFLFWLNGGGYCVDEADCYSYLPVVAFDSSMKRLPMHKHDTFSKFNHLYFKNCDLGIYMGDRGDPVEYNGQKLYFQGGRIMKLVVSELSRNYTMKEVFIAGGSGGGHSIYAMSDYFSSLLPSTVTKFGAAPLNGWYVNDQDELEYMFQMQGMQNTISPGCKKAFSSSEQYKCLDPFVAYRHSETATFLTQIFDYTFEHNVSDDVTTSYENCLSTEKEATGECKTADVELLQDYLDNYTELLTTYPKYTKNGGGYLSTCTKHTFYDDDDLWEGYENNGVTAGDAIAKWWHSLGKQSASTWYLPCTLGSAQHPQCESTCSLSA